MASAIQVASLYGTLSLRDSMTPGLQAAQRTAAGFGSQMQGISSGLQSFGGAMTGLMAPAGAALAVGISQSNQFSRSMSNINSVLQLNQQDLATLSSQLLQIGGNSVAGPQAITNAYYEIASGVADATTHMSILDAAIATSEAGQADLTETTSAFISTMNSYGFAAEDAAFVSDIFSRTMAMGKGSMGEFAAAFPQVTGLAAQFGIGLEEVGGALSYVSVQGFSASQSATFLRSMMTTLLNPTTELEEAIVGLGFSSGQAMLESEGLVGAYQLLASQGGGLAGLITNQEALMGSLILTGDAAEGFLNTYTTGIPGATAAAGAMQDQTEGWDRLRSKMSELSITAGNMLSPVLLDLANNQIIPLINRVTEWAGAHPELTRNILLVTGGLVILGPIIAGVGAVVGALTTIIGGLMTVALGPLGLAIAAGSLLVLAYTNNWMGFKDFIDGTIRPIIDRLIEDIRTLNSLVGNPLGLESAMNIPAAGTWTHEGGGFGASGGPPPNSGRAGGGSVMAGSAYIVGERGPEIFRPGTSGTIVNNADMMAGGGGETVNYNGAITVMANDVDSFERQLQERRRRRR